MVPHAVGSAGEVSGAHLLMTEIAATLARAVAQQPAPTADRLGEAALMEILAAVVSHAGYRGPPDEEELAAADPPCRSAAWWTRPLLVDDQR